MNRPGNRVSPYFRRFRIFGWNIYITRHVLKHKAKLNGRSRKLAVVKASRLKFTEYHCELCGISVNKQCSLYHLLPVGHPLRNTFEHVRVICSECKCKVETRGGYRPMIPMATAIEKEGGEI